MDRTRLVYASAVSAICAILFAAVITIAAELSPALKEWLKGISGHHWTTKSIFTMALYFIGLISCYLFPHKYLSPARIRSSLYLLFFTTILGTLAVTGFFVWHYLA